MHFIVNLVFVFPQQELRELTEGQRDGQAALEALEAAFAVVSGD